MRNQEAFLQGYTKLVIPILDAVGERHFPNTLHIPKELLSLPQYSDGQAIAHLKKLPLSKCWLQTQSIRNSDF